MQKRHHFRLSSSRRPGGTEGVEFREPFMRPLAPLFRGQVASLHLYVLKQGQSRLSMSGLVAVAT